MYGQLQQLVRKLRWKVEYTQSTTFTTSPVTSTTKQTSSTTSTAYSTTVSVPYTTWSTSFSTGYSQSTSGDASRSTDYSTSRTTAYTSSWNYAYSTTGSGSRSTGYSASRSTSYSASRSTTFTTSQNTSFTTSWTYSAITAYSESGNRATNYQTSRYTESGSFGGGWCVTEGTPVHINATDTVLIETLQVGDQVYSKDGGFNTDDENLMHTFASANIIGQPQQATVTRVYQATSNQVISINNGMFKATKDHFMIVKQEASDASIAWRIRPLYICLVGDYFMDVDGNEVEITSIDELTEEFNVWKIDTEPADVFYAGGILTHNSVPINNP
jgi:hypothetical protein